MLTYRQIFAIESDHLQYTDEDGEQQIIKFQDAHEIARKQVNRGMLKYVARESHTGDWLTPNMPFIEFTTLPPVRFVCPSVDSLETLIAQITAHGWAVTPID